MRIYQSKEDRYERNMENDTIYYVLHGSFVIIDKCIANDKPVDKINNY